eukprot:29749-Pelagococcus_subviridis.AAC.4
MQSRRERVSDARRVRALVRRRARALLLPDPVLLRLPHLRVPPPSLQQLPVRPLLGHHAVLQHRDAIAVPRGGEPMRDENRRPPAHEIPDGAHDPRLRLRVERARRLVQQHHPGVLQKRARERDPLLLPAAELQPALADDGVVPVRHRAHRVVDRRAFRRGHDFLLARGVVLASVRDVIPDRVVEQDAVLRDDADVPSQRFRRHVSGVLPAEPHRAALRVVEPVQETQHRGLAAAGRAHEREAPARGHREGQALQDVASPVLAAAAVPEDDVVERDV